MNTIRFTRFLKKYYLNGLINSAVWVKSSGTLNVKVITESGKLFAGVTLKNFDGIGDTEIGVLDTRKLLKMLSPIMDETVSVDVVKLESGAVGALTFTSPTMEIQYATSYINDMDGPAIICHIPTFNAAIKMDAKFIRWFGKAFTVFKDADMLFTPVMSDRTGKLEVAMNYRETRISDRLTCPVTTVENLDILNAPLDFNAKCLKNILKANPEFKDPILYVSDAGLAAVKFSDDELDSEYYMVKIETEE